MFGVEVRVKGIHDGPVDFRDRFAALGAGLFFAAQKIQPAMT